MEQNLKTSAEKRPNYSDGMMLDAFEASHDHETHISRPDGFKTALEDIVVQKLIECQTPKEYEEFDSQLKLYIIDFIDVYIGEPWAAPDDEPGIAEYIKPAIKLVTSKDEFVNSKAFTDAVVKHSFKVAPFSMKKVSDLIALTDTDISEKIHQQISQTLHNTAKLPDFTYSFKTGDEIPSTIISYYNLLDKYPSAELDEQCFKWEKRYRNYLSK